MTSGADDFSLSLDHRALDGADGARLLGWVVQALEDPLGALLGPAGDA